MRRISMRSRPKRFMGHSGEITTEALMFWPVSKSFMNNGLDSLFMVTAPLADLTQMQPLEGQRFGTRVFSTVRHAPESQRNVTGLPFMFNVISGRIAIALKISHELNTFTNASGSEELFTGFSSGPVFSSGPASSHLRL